MSSPARTSRRTGSGRVVPRFGPDDAASVVRSLEARLTRNRLAKHEFYQADPEARRAAVLANARDGAHQVGTIRMARESGQGVVDGRCRVFGTPGFHVVSTAVLPTSLSGAGGTASLPGRQGRQACDG